MILEPCTGSSQAEILAKLRTMLHTAGRGAPMTPDTLTFTWDRPGCCIGLTSARQSYACQYLCPVHKAASTLRSRTQYHSGLSNVRQAVAGLEPWAGMIWCYGSGFGIATVQYTEEYVLNVSTLLYACVPMPVSAQSQLAVLAFERVRRVRIQEQLSALTCLFLADEESAEPCSCCGGDIVGCSRPQTYDRQMTD